MFEINLQHQESEQIETISLLMAAGQLTKDCSHSLSCLLEFGLISRQLFPLTSARHRLPPGASFCCLTRALWTAAQGPLEKCTFLSVDSAPIPELARFILSHPFVLDSHLFFFFFFLPLPPP